MFTVNWLPGTEAWKPPVALDKLIRRYFGSLQGTRVVVWPRSREVLEDLFPAMPDMAYYQVRAVSRGPEVHILVDETETPESIAWLLAHELTHQLVAVSPAVAAAMADAEPLGEASKASDQYHEDAAEEKLADGIATRLVGQRLDRAWWRERTR